MKKDKEKIKTQNKNIFKTTLNYYIRLSEYSSVQRINHSLNVCVSKVFTY